VDRYLVVFWTSVVPRWARRCIWSIVHENVFSRGHSRTAKRLKKIAIENLTRKERERHRRKRGLNTDSQRC
jgi:hypothetical protein